MTCMYCLSPCVCVCVYRFLLQSGAFPAPVNNEGDIPVELSEDEEIRTLLYDEIEKQGEEDKKYCVPVSGRE